ncbi:DNA-3-methyladenine glycosylase [Puniceibacterium sp. IMCC21224]|uniref:DNA-3-methyladenine glycosylase family protein n=1 Tax=Puniceibacterium sp. IMCC21224 TaxID=1618204 RepID=UPI00065D3659|nr:DNA-3-methyladenine glycosylase 2 family protein [Puniceibacterium sp. IMCC21224]KMK67583.1 HhH-GPD superfamily base excision DNA repair protein [Puniceibacterium sp. IMCC21224]
MAGKNMTGTETRGIERVIVSDACVAEGAAWLAASEPRFARALEVTGPLPLRLRDDGFDQLLSAILSQQVSVASARAIWARLEAANCTTPDVILDTDDETLRGLGLSRQKARYARALAEARIDFVALRDCPTDEVIKRLTAVTGIGIWTAEIYAMFSLGRADVFAPGDLALQEGARLLFDLPERPRDRDLRQMAEAWSPWRSVAARTLWAYYHVEKQREGIS